MGSVITVLQAAVNMNRGGAETLLMNLYRHIDRSKVQFHFLTCREGCYDDEIRSLGGVIHRIPYIDKIGPYAYRAALKQFFTEYGYQYQVVHSHMDRMSGLVLYAAKQAGVPVRIAHSHNTRSEGSLAAKLYKRYASLYIGFAATHRFACSEEAGKWLFPWKRREVQLLKNGIMSDMFAYRPLVRHEVRKELGIAEGTIVLGHVGRFNEQKNHALLLDIFRSWLRRNVNSCLLLAGEGPLRLAMEEKARSLDMSENVKFLGVRSDIERLMQAFDAFVFPSRHEGLPVTLIEAQAAGLPCIVSDTITREVDLGMGLVTFHANGSLREYEEAIQSVSGRERRMDTQAELYRCGYDIRETAAWLQQYYRKQCEVNHESDNRVYAHL
ncbi:glycosyltransferase family 1 protein [Paenibacillus chungangensis]|uniref:Glycosyltransferase family 1 protein n=1 Tax=Paenibacillus chungangensis TaxID=696535 RepID=A0ABW3HV29_9BACL